QLHISVVMVKPGGTGRPRLPISARFAPLPPRRFLSPARPSAAPSPKVYTHLLMPAPRLAVVEMPRPGLDAGSDKVPKSERQARAWDSGHLYRLKTLDHLPRSLCDA